MSTNTTPRQESDGSTELNDRDVRALTEYMTVLDKGGDIYTVIGENGGGAYHVDSRKGRCTCPDHKHGSTRCKHIRRVGFATGDEAIPAWIDRGGLDSQLGDHVAGEVHFSATDGGVTVSTNEGELTDRDNAEKNTQRPNDCDCRSNSGTSDLPCWPCYQVGFDAPNSKPLND